MREFREVLARLELVVRTIAKQDFLNDLVMLIKALEPHDKEDLAAFVAACQAGLEASAPTEPKRKQTDQLLNDELVADYVRRLQNSYKESEQFMPVYEALRADKGVSKAELAKIASGLAYETPASTPKKEFLAARLANPRKLCICGCEVQVFERTIGGLRRAGWPVMLWSLARSSR